jgi:hypothetical protein
MPTHEVRCDPVSSHDHLDVVSNLQSITASGFRAATSRTAAALKGSPASPWQNGFAERSIKSHAILGELHHHYVRV